MKRWQLPIRDVTRLTPPSPHDGNGARPQVRLRSADATPPGHRTQRPRLLQPLPLAGLVLVVIALTGYWSVYSGAARRTAVLVAARDLPAGATLSGRDLRVASLAGDQAVLAGLLPAQERAALRGRRLATPLLAGQPLPRAALAARTRGPAAFTLAVPALHALGGELQPGDRVSVLVTYGSGQGQARAQAIARSLTVLSLGAAPTGLDRATATIAVTVALPDPSLASALALANSDGKIDLLRERGNSAAPIPTASERAAP